MVSRTYVTAYAACGLLFLLAPVAGFIMALITTMALIDELTSRPKKPYCDCTAMGAMSLSCNHPICWQPEPEPETGLEALKKCSCHERMGNDWYFLPRGQCLNGKCDGNCN